MGDDADRLAAAMAGMDVREADAMSLASSNAETELEIMRAQNRHLQSQLNTMQMTTTTLTQQLAETTAAASPEQMKHIDQFVRAGKPLLAIRTATHPFNFGDANHPYAHWSWNNGKWQGGFGQQVVGETWVSHHGVHNGQATRGVINPKHADSPILRGVSDVFGPTDVYGVVHLPADAKVVMFGQVLSGMKPTDPPLEGEKNDPMQALVWTKSYRMPEGNGQPEGKAGLAVGSTIGAAVDLLNEDLRRLFVNCVYSGVGIEVPAKASVSIPESYKPSYFGFKDKAFFTDKKILPKDLLKN